MSISKELSQLGAGLKDLYSSEAYEKDDRGGKNTRLILGVSVGLLMGILGTSAVKGIGSGTDYLWQKYFEHQQSLK